MADDSFIHLVNGYLEGKLDKNDLKRFLELIEESAENRELLARNALINRLIQASRHNPVPAEQILMALPRHGDTAKLIIDQIRNSSLNTETQTGKQTTQPARKTPTSTRKKVSRRNSFQSRPDRLPPIVLVFRTAAALAASLLLGFGVWKYAVHQDSTPGPCIATLDASGEVMIKRGNQQIRGTTNLRLYNSDTIYVGPQSTAAVLYNNESTFVKLQEWTVLTLGTVAGAKQLALQGGTIAAGVAPQPATQPMTISTPKASATVLGTQFNIRSTRASTAIEVTSGKVRMARTLDNSSADVPAGHKLELDDASPLSVQQIPTPVLGHLSEQQLVDMFQTMATAKAWGINTFTYTITPGNTATMPASLGSAIATAHKGGARFYAKLDIPADITSQFDTFMPAAKNKLARLLASYSLDGIYITRPKELTEQQFKRAVDEIRQSVKQACITIDTGVQHSVSTNDTWFIGY